MLQNLLGIINKNKRLKKSQDSLKINDILNFKRKTIFIHFGKLKKFNQIHSLRGPLNTYKGHI